MTKLTQKPIIGIILDSAIDSAKYSFAALPWYALRKCYINAISMNHGVPILIPHSIEDVDNFINIIDGLLIPGGDEDINPKFYNQTTRSSKVKTNDSRAEFELRITQKALDLDMPIFGICNGLQLINVLRGGTLIQHIPDVIQSSINHEQPAPKNIPSHFVEIAHHTKLSTMTQENNIEVNSTHHQAIDQVGSGIIVSARSEDGIIEAIEMPDNNFVIGVQWHSEYLNTDLDKNLFRLFVETARNFASLKNHKSQI